ncbi:natterin-4-like [Epinephelus fuscoguttatus]|uniref:natterin-4-like n=1 Tax=Epinephelus fuscoguttatus TaxID=293821 RepID=UPI0020D018C2|nr:natterin-4-like [Epinephelus fuscoguttatus]
MKLSVLLLPALLALSSASLQDIVKKSAQHRKDKVPFLNPDLGNRIPQIPANGSVLPPLTPAKFEKRLGQSSSYMFGGSSLEWQTTYGTVPSGAFYIYNEYVGGRVDYVCKYRCSSGFYNPSMGPYCHYPLSGKENRGRPFEILVNKGGIEDLYWQDDSWGDVPPNSVKTCPGLDLYVGKNKYGLGKVHQSNGAFFLPWQGDEYWYKYYQVLIINKNVRSEHMSNVKYNTNVETVALPPEIVTTSDIANNECSSVVKTVELSGTYQEEKRWDTSIATTVGVSSTITAQIPFISASIGFSAETTEEFSSGSTKVTSKTRSVSVEVTVPPNHSCSVSMVGHKYKASIPFTAHLTRTYGNGRTKLAYVSGVFHGVNVGRVQSVVDRCEPVPNAQPCSE